MTLYEKVLNLCHKEGFEISNLGENLGISITKGSISKWKNGAKPRADTIKSIADYFKVPVSYLTDESITEIQTVNDNHGIIGNPHAPVTIMNSDAGTLNEQEMELLNIFRKLSVMKQAQLLVRAAELLEE